MEYQEVGCQNPIRSRSTKSAPIDLKNQCRIAGLPEPEPEYRFHPKRKWRIDYAWPSFKLAVEIEGGIWTRGRHNRPVGYLRDAEKYNQLTMDGWALLRFTPDGVRNGTAISVIMNWFANLA